MELKSIIPNYKMNLLWAYNIKDIDKFKSDLQYILYMLKYKEEKDILPIYTMIKDHPNESKEEIYKLLQAN